MSEVVQVKKPGAPHGNQNASKKHNLDVSPTKVRHYKKLAIDWMIKVMTGDDEDLKKQLVFKTAGQIIPKPSEAAPTQELRPLVFHFEKYEQRSDKKIP